jgi:hypothetical protein
LAHLLAAQQAQLHGLQDALVAARKQPIWNSSPVRIGEAGLALLGVAKLLGR